MPAPTISRSSATAPTSRPTCTVTPNTSRSSSSSHDAGACGHALQRLGRRFDEEIVHVAVAPVLAVFQALDDGVFGLVIVLGGVFVGRLIAAADVSALNAEPQVYPTGLHLE